MPTSLPFSVAFSFHLSANGLALPALPRGLTPLPRALVPARRLALCLLAIGLARPTLAAPQGAIEIAKNLTFSGNFDFGHRETQFFEADHNATVGQWDVRLEYWMPFGEPKSSFGPFANVSGIKASKNQPWENAWQALPAAGLQLYPFSFQSLRDTTGWLGEALGQLRIYGQVGRQKFWGPENAWRPKQQSRYGLEYWRAMHVNDAELWWGELWGSWWRQESNEFTDSYRTWILAAAVRTGLRVPHSGWLSAATPYVVAETSSTRNYSYYWENRLTLGGGLRITPLIRRTHTGSQWLNRFVIYGEYVKAEKYFRALPPPSLPDHDVRFGVSFSLGAWYY